MEDGRTLECAGRCLAAALVEKDLITLAALLRAAAKYIEGNAHAGLGGPVLRRVQS